MTSSPSSLTTLAIRPEIESDRPQIASLLQRAFGGSDEATLVERLADEGYVVLSLVAHREGTVLGQILFSRLTIANENGRHDALALAPLAVDPDHQKQGIGTKLVLSALEALQKQGHKRVIVLGHPEYYRRFGFCSDLARKLNCAFSGHEAFMALEWSTISEPSELHGTLTYPPPFGVFT